MRETIQQLSKELDEICNTIQLYNDSDTVDIELEKYLSCRKDEIIRELTDYSFGSNVEIL